MEKTNKYRLLMILAMVIWGGSWVCAKLISTNLHYQKLVFIRFVLTFLFFIPPVFIFRENLRIGLDTAKRIVIGSLFYTLYSQVFFLGLSRGSAGLGGILVTSLVPVITFAIMSFSTGLRIGFREAAGLAMGFLGSLVILKIDSVSSQQLFLSGNIFFVIGAFLWAGVTINSQKTQSTISLWVYSFYLNGVASILQLAFVTPYGLDGLFPADISFWILMIYLSLMSTVFATSLYFYSTRLIGSYKASAFTFIVPSSAVILSWIFLHEIPAPTTLVGGCISIAALYLIQSNRDPVVRRGNELVTRTVE
jgi:drug/metabolite transporter (DMT)-like permease